MTHNVPVQEEIPNNARRVYPEENIQTIYERVTNPCHPLSPIYEEPGLKIPPPPDYSPQAGQRRALLPNHLVQRQVTEHEGYQSVQEEDAHSHTVTSERITLRALYIGTGEQPAGSGFGEPSLHSTRVPLIIPEISTRGMKQMMKIMDKMKGVPLPEEGDNLENLHC